MMKKLMLALFVAVLTFGSVQAQSNLAHVSTQKVLDTMPSRKSAMVELERFEERAFRELQETQKKLQDDYNKLQSEKVGMSPTAYKFEEDRLMRKSQEFQQRQQELDQQLKMLANELNTPVLERLQEAVNIVSKREKLNYVMDISALLYSDGKDITNMVIVEALRLEKEASKTAAE